MTSAEPGRYDVQEIEGDPEWWGYWHAFVGDVRVNGGVCTNFTDGAKRARRAIEAYRKAAFRRDHYWDVETGQWVKNGQWPYV